jgi:glycosyltransferase involved in cell wall biosynthesis
VPTKAEQTDQAKVKLAKVDPEIDLQFAMDLPVLYKRWQNARFEGEALVEQLDRFDPELLVLPSADFVLNSLLINRPLRRLLAKLHNADFVVHNFHQAYPTVGPGDAYRRFLDRLSVERSRSVRLHAVDPYATTPRARRLSFLPRKILPLPHPYERMVPHAREEARAMLGLPQADRLIGAIGDLGVRKGIDLLVDSFAQLRRDDLKLVLLGVLTKPIRDQLATHPELIDRGQIILRDEFMSDEVFHASFYALDAIWAGYPRQLGIASMLLFAADALCPVIASNFGCVSWMTEEYGLGMTFTVDQAGAIEALNRFADACELRVDPDGAARLLGYHTLANFEAEITRNACSQMTNAVSPVGVSS